MKLQLKRKRGALSVVFKAETDQDGIDLKDAVQAAVRGVGFSPAAIIDELDRIRSTRTPRDDETSKAGA